MHIVLVHVHVTPDSVDSLKKANLGNPRGSVQETGVVRFDVLQQADDPTRFTLVEVYQTPEDQIKHRETAHYLKWRDAVGGMMAEPRQGIRYTNLFPEDPWIKVYVKEDRLGLVKLGQKARITTDSYPGKIYAGVVNYISSEAEFTPKSVQTQEERVKLVFGVKVSVKNQNNELKPGMPADVKIILKP